MLILVLLLIASTTGSFWTKTRSGGRVIPLEEDGGTCKAPIEGVFQAVQAQRVNIVKVIRALSKRQRDAVLENVSGCEILTVFDDICVVVEQVLAVSLRRSHLRISNFMPVNKSELECNRVVESAHPYSASTDEYM